MTSPIKAKIMLDGWAGRTNHSCEIIGETPTRYRVKLSEDITLPGNRFKKKGEITLIPKYAIRKVNR